MTTYTTITDAEVSPETCLKESLFQRLANNPIAITEGASGAPKILSPALQTGASAAVTTATMRDLCFTTAKILDGTISEGKLAAAVSGMLVTGGNSHNHIGGGGYLGNGSFVDNAFTEAKFYLEDFSYGTITVPALGSFTPSKGWYILTVDNVNVVLDVTFWANGISSRLDPGMRWCDGINMSLVNSGASSRSVYYLKFKDI